MIKALINFFTNASGLQNFVESKNPQNIQEVEDAIRREEEAARQEEELIPDYNNLPDPFTLIKNPNKFVPVECDYFMMMDSDDKLLNNLMSIISESKILPYFKTKKRFVRIFKKKNNITKKKN
jgi:hypothetical protein